MRLASFEPALVGGLRYTRAMTDDSDPSATDRHRRRLELVWEVALMQLKLIVGGVRDLALIPISIGAAVLGLVTGGDEPEQHFRKVQHFWRRTEAWINLLGESEAHESADDLARPLHRTLEAEFDRGGWVRRTTDHVNAVLDSANAKSRRPPRDDPPADLKPRDSAARTSEPRE